MFDPVYNAIAIFQLAFKIKLPQSPVNLSKMFSGHQLSISCWQRVDGRRREASRQMCGHYIAWVFIIFHPSSGLQWLEGWEEVWHTSEMCKSLTGPVLPYRPRHQVQANRSSKITWHLYSNTFMEFTRLAWMVPIGTVFKMNYFRKIPFILMKINERYIWVLTIRFIKLQYAPGALATHLSMDVSSFWQREEIRSPNLLINTYHQGCMYVCMYMHIAFL